MQHGEVEEQIGANTGRLKCVKLGGSVAKQQQQQKVGRATGKEAPKTVHTFGGHFGAVKIVQQAWHKCRPCDIVRTLGRWFKPA